MVRILLGNLKDMGEDVSAFLEERLKVKPDLKSDVIEIGGVDGTPTVKGGDVKTYLKRFLHNKGLRDKYRVFVNQDEVKLVEREEITE